MSSLRHLKVAFDSFDELVESIAPGLSRTHLFARTEEEIDAGTRVRLELGTVRRGAVIRGVAKVAGPGDRASEPGLRLHLIHLDPSSTRLVDSIVRGEPAAGAAEASGPSPFDIPPAAPVPQAEVASQSAEDALARSELEPVGPTEPLPPTARRFQRLVWPLALAATAVVFLLAFELVAGRGERLLTGRDRQTADLEPHDGIPASGVPASGGDEGEGVLPEAPAPTEEQPVVSTVSGATASGATVSGAETRRTPLSESPPASSESLAAEVVQVVYSWADAWSRQDPDAYLTFYAPDYSPPGLDRDTWEQQRRTRLEAPRRLEVRLSELDVEEAGEGRAVVRFHQLYVTDDKSLAARKVLELRRLAAGWRIVAERLGP